MNVIIVLIYGLAIGSFLNVCICRIPKEESIVYPPSHCTSCGGKIKWYDLIPVLSYIFLKGKCRFCNEKISLRYPLTELLTGIIFVCLYYKFGLTYHFVKYAVLISILIVIGMIDYDTTDVYLNTIIAGIATGIIFLLYELFFKADIRDYLYGALFAAGVISLIVIITKGMGWGDAEICFVSGLYFGFKLTFIMLILTFIIGAITGIVLIVLKKKSRKDYIPFGPFISIASIITVFFGEKILIWYLKSLMY